MNSSRSLQITAKDPQVRASVENISSCEGIDIYRVTVCLPENTAPSAVTIEWEEAMVDHLSVWTPLGGREHAIHQWFAPTTSNSNFSAGAPVLCTIGENGRNTETVAVSDAVTPITMQFCVKDLDQKDKVGYTVSFFTGYSSPVETYTADIRIDRRSIPFYEAIRSVTPWWAEYGYTFLPCPAAAEDALYSSWYNFHQAPEQERLLADLKIAAEMGFRTVILDDGWQFPGPSSGDYSECGLWQVTPDKFPDFKGFVDQVHALGMKLMVWFGLPFIGVKSPLFKKFAGKYLYVRYGVMQCGTLDPRYPDVREYIKDTYKRFLRDYDIDGFKLDFIDAIAPMGTDVEYTGEMDTRSIEESIRILLEEITSELAERKPDLLYEYRQRYVGPGINRFGNMLRVGDCAYDALTNRIGVIDLRLLNYPIAVHSDMLFWAKEESIVLCAKQLLNIFFSVPQISVILADSTEEQRVLLRQYLQYWTENRDLILHGTFRAFHPEMNYTAASVENEEKMITVLYADIPYVYTGKDCDVLHNGDENSLIFENPTDRNLHMEIFDCLGNRLQTGTIAPESVMRLPVPRTGRLHVRQLS